VLKKNGFWIFAFVAFLILSAGGGDDNKKAKRAKKLRSQAENVPAIEVQKQQEVVKNVEFEEKMGKLFQQKSASNEYDVEEELEYNDDYEAEEELEQGIELAMEDVDEAEEEEIEINDSMLVASVRSMEDSVKFYLGRVFGYGGDADDDDESMSESSADIKLTEDQLDIIAKKISERLQADVTQDFRAKADAIAEEKISEIDEIVAEGRDADMNAGEIANDVSEVEAVVVADLKDEIDEAAVKVKDALPERMKKIRNEVVQEETGKRLDDIEARKRERKERKKAALKDYKQMKRDDAARKNNRDDESMKRTYDKDDGYVAKKKVMVIDSEDEQKSYSKPKKHYTSSPDGGYDGGSYARRGGDDSDDEPKSSPKKVIETSPDEGNVGLSSASRNRYDSEDE